MEKDIFFGCQECSNFCFIDFAGKEVAVCSASMPNPKKCCLYKKEALNNDK